MIQRDPVIHTCDVLVMGGGIGGLMAARRWSESDHCGKGGYPPQRFRRHGK